jgi:hypothetical protein
MIAGHQDVPPTSCFRGIFLEVDGCFGRPVEDTSHDHGMESARRFDDVLGVFNTHPIRQKVLP